MTRYLRALAGAILKAIRPAPPQPDPLLAFLDGMEVPHHLIGRHFDVVDPEGRVVATTRKPVDPRIEGMIG